MIHDHLANAARYQPLHPRFAAAFAWLADPANRAQPDGRHAIQGDALFAILDSGRTGPAATKRFESHRRYIDIQVNLRGGEVMEWTPLAGLTVADDFAPDGDIAFYHAPTHAPTRLHVRPEEFAIFWPEDAHKPCCDGSQGATDFRKVVFKVERL